MPTAGRVCCAARRGAWSVEPGHLDAWLRPVPPKQPRPRVRQLRLDDQPYTDVEGGHESAAEPGSPDEPDLAIRLHQLGEPWKEDDLQHVFNIVHAELHGCDAVTVQGRAMPTSRYHELRISTAKSGELVRHAATLAGVDLDDGRRRRLSRDAHEPD